MSDRIHPLDSMNRANQIVSRAANGAAASTVHEASFLLNDYQSIKHIGPKLAYGRHRGPIHPTTRIASVVALLFPQGNRWLIPLTVRSANLADHAGQVSLPGGRIEEGETIEQAARRELTEELGVHDSHARTLQVFRPLYVFASDYLVHPLLMQTKTVPDFRRCPDEVARIIFFTVPTQIGQIEIIQRTVRRGNASFIAPGFEVEGQFVWGATAMILMHILQSLPISSKVELERMLS